MTTQLPESRHVYVSAENKPLHLYTLEELITYGNSRFEEGSGLSTKQPVANSTSMSEPVPREIEP